jgi:hypothetical protein
MEVVEGGRSAKKVPPRDQQVKEISKINIVYKGL